MGVRRGARVRLVKMHHRGAAKQTVRFELSLELCSRAGRGQYDLFSAADQTHFIIVVGIQGGWVWYGAVHNPSLRLVLCSDEVLDLAT